MYLQIFETFFLTICEDITNFAPEHNYNDMTTTQLNADILRNLGIIANDESKLNRVAK